MDPQEPPSWRRVPGPRGLASQEARARSRDHGIRHVRRLSNWTAVALMAATAVTAGYFARAQAGARQSISVTGTTGSHSPASPASSGAPCVTVPVAVSGGSGVTPAPAPAQSCAPGPGGQARPAVVTVQQGEDRGD